MRKTFLALSIILLIVGIFQNCGPAAYRTGSDPSAAGFSIDYPYLQKPNHYVDAQILVDSASSGQLKQFKILINVGEPEARELVLSYKIEIKDASGKVMCPSKSGSLQTDETQIELDCVSPYVDSQVHAKVTVTLDKKVESFDFIF